MPLCVYMTVLCVCVIAPQRSPSTFPGGFSVSRGTPHVLTLYWQVGWCETYTPVTVVNVCSMCSYRCFIAMMECVYVP